MATVRLLGCLRSRTSLQRLLQLNSSLPGYTHARCLHQAAILYGVDPIKIFMPALSPTMEEGTIAKWLKQEGEEIAAGDAICDIETDKSTVTLDSDEDGTLAKIMIPEGTKGIKIKTLIGLMVAEGEDYKDVDMASIEADEAAPSSAAAGAGAEAERVSDTTQFSSMRHAVGKDGATLSPAVRQLIEQHNLDPSSIPGSGPHGRLLKGDVLKFLDSPLAAKVEPAPEPPRQRELPPEAYKDVHIEPKVGQKPSRFVEPILTITEAPEGCKFDENQIINFRHGSCNIQQEFTDREISDVQRLIAKRLGEAHFFVPQAYATIDCRLNELFKLKEDFADKGFQLGVGDFMIKATATTLQKFPEINAGWDDGIKLYETIDISVAVETERGLITPIVRKANKRGLVGIAHTIKDLLNRAEQGRLKPEEFHGGSFSVAYLGMYDVSHLTYIVNPPQCANISIGGPRLVPSLEGSTKPDYVAAVTMSTDLRVVDGVAAAEFLEAFKKNIENPLTLGLL